MPRGSIEARAIITALLLWVACSPASTRVQATSVGPHIVLDADSSSRSFVVHACYETPERLSSVKLAIEAEARPTGIGEIEPWVRILIEPTFDDEEPPDLVDGRLSSGATKTLFVEHWLDESTVLDAEIENRSSICEEGMAVVTFELVDPTESSRVEIDWDASVESSVFTEPEAFEVHVEG